MTNRDLREQIKESIYDFSSKEWQYEAWFVCNQIISTPSEDYCIFFDDLGIESYIDIKDNYLTKKENEELKKFIDILKEYDSQYRDENGIFNPDPEKVFYDEEWDRIRQEAGKLYDLMEKEEGVKELKLIENWTL